MALFKIEKGLATNLSKNRPNTVEGYCYVTTDDGKFYIDIATGSGTTNRIVLNAGTADKLATARTITLDGKVTGSASFDGSKDVTINVDTTEIEQAIAALPSSASNGIKIVDNVIKHTNSVTAGTASEGGSTRTLAFGGTFNVPGVTYDAQGHIKSQSSVTLTLPANPNTDTKVTSVGNHYAPAEDTSAILQVDASGASNTASWNSTNLVTGVNIKRDAKGHVTGVTVDSIKMPANPDTNTTYTLTGDFAEDDTSYVTTLTPSSGTATTATIPLMRAASSSADGAPGLVPKAIAGNQAKFLRADGTWQTPANTNTYQRLYPSTNDVEYPITSRYNTTTGSNYYAEYGRYNTEVTLNPAKKTITAPGGFIGTADAAKEVPWSGVTNKPNYYDGKAITSISRNGTTYTVTYLDGTTSTFTQQDTNTTYDIVTASKDGLVPKFDAADGTIDSSTTDWVLTNNNGTIGWHLLPANAFKNDNTNTTYSLSKSGSTITLTGSDGITSTVSDANTHYTTGIVVGATGTADNSATTNGNTYIKVKDDSTYRSQIKITGSGATTVSSDANGVITISSTDNNDNTAHSHSAGVGLTGSGNAGTSGTYTYKVNLVNDTASSNASSYAAGGTSKFYAVQLDKNNKLAVAVPWTDTNTKVTSVGNHYTPAEDTASALSADASDATGSASWGSTNLVTGIDLQRDAKGHVVGISVDSIKMPSNPNTTYSAGTGLSLSGTKFNHSNSVTAKTTNNQTTATPGYGGTFKVTEPLYDAQGHITGVNVATITMPSAQTIPTSFTINATATDDDVVILTGTNGSNKVTFDAKHAQKGPSSGYTSANSTTSISGSGGSGTIKIPQITVDTYGHVTAAADESVTITMPTLPTTLKNPNVLKFGNQTYDGSAEKTITAADFGLSNALHFKGVLASLPAATTNYVDGDVVLVGNKEYVVSNSTWVELGDESSFSLKDHTHSYAGSSSVGGAATSANKVNSSLSIQLNGGTATVFDGSAEKSINITPSSIGAAASSHGTHVTWSTTTPKVNGTATVGSETKVARGDHVHPTDTTRAAASDLTSHTSNTTVHITSTERTNWGTAYTHSQAAHAPSDAQKNQNAFSNVAIGNTTIEADTATDTLTLEAGANITLTPDATNDKITITATDTVYTHPTSAGNKHIPSGGESGQILRWSAAGTATWGADNDTTYSAATDTTLGLVKVSSVNSSAVTVNSESTTSGRYYPVEMNSDNKLIVNVPWTNTNTKVTSAANHYAPAEDTAAALSVDASSTTKATWGSTSLVTGVNLQRDAKGHVVGVTVDSIQMPANPDTNTTYSAGTGLTLSDTTFSVSKANASAILNLLAVGDASIGADTYIITSHATDTTSTTFYKRPASLVVNATLVKAALGTGDGTTKYLREDGTWVAPPNNKVTQGRSTSGSWRPLLSHATYGDFGTNPGTVTDQVYYNESIAMQPSTGTIKATSFDGKATSATYADSAGTCTALSTNAGSTTQAIYFTGGKPSACNTNIAHNAKGLYGHTKLTSATVDAFKESGVLKWATADNTAVGSNDGMVISLSYDATYAAQIWLDDGTNEGGMKIRNWNGTNSAWNPWRQVLTEQNYKSYALALTGGTLTGDTTIKNGGPELFLQNTSADKGTTPSSTYGGSVWFMDKNGTATKNAMGRVYGYNSSNGYNAVRLYAYKQEADSTDTAYIYVQYGSDGVKKAGSSASFYGAVWNDYAEFRGQKEEIEPGYCVTSNKDGKVSKTTERMQYCEGIVSDTFGFSIGETDECKTPLAVSGRVLAYYAGDIQDYEIGDVVCANFDGKIIKMTRDEIREYPDRIVGTVSEFPSYDTWGDGDVPTAGRIWIKVR